MSLKGFTIYICETSGGVGLITRRRRVPIERE